MLRCALASPCVRVLPRTVGLVDERWLVVQVTHRALIGHGRLVPLPGRTPEGIARRAMQNSKNRSEDLPAKMLDRALTSTAEGVQKSLGLPAHFYALVLATHAWPAALRVRRGRAQRRPMSAPTSSLTWLPGQ